MAAAHLPGSTLSTLAAITAPSTAVPRVPPTCMAACWRPPATPASSTGALPTITSVAPTMTGLRPRPSSTNQSDSSPEPVPGCRSDIPNMATAVSTMPVTMGIRGPVRPMTTPAIGEPTISIAVIGSRCSPASTGDMPRTFCR